MEPLGDRDPRRVGPFTLTGRLGVSSVGTVFHGRSASGRQVAVTVVHDHLAAGASFRAGFGASVEAARGLRGIAIAQVVDADPQASPPWVATRYVEGPTLAERVGRDGPLPVEEVLGLAAGVAEALGAIHAAGLVHGDLRPGAVIMSSDGPQVIHVEFGGSLESGTHSSATGEANGRFEYLAPEQIRAEPVAAAVDVFALGGLLCFAATGAPPFGAGHPGQLIGRIQHTDPELSAVTEPRLGALVARCLAKDPADRPSTADVLADAAAVRAVLGPTVVMGSPPAPAVWAGPASQPAPAVWAEPAAWAEPVTPRPVTPTEPPDQVTPDLDGRTAHPGPAQAPAPPRRAVLLGGAVAAGAAVVAVAGGSVWWLRRPAPTRTSPAPYRELAAHAGPVRAVAWAPDGTTLATANGNSAAVIWDAATGAERVRLGDRSMGPWNPSADVIAYAPDSRTVATGGGNGTVVIWDVATGTALRTLPVSDRSVTAVAFSPDGARLATASPDGIGRIWDLRTGRALQWLRGHGELLLSVAFSPDGALVATADPDAVRVWDSRTGALVRRLDGGWLWATFSPDGATLASGWSDKQSVVLWDVATGTRRRTLQGHTNGVVEGSFSRDGRTLVTASFDETARVWDVESGATRGQVYARTTLHGVAAAPDGRTLVTAGNDGSATVWDAAGGRRVRTLAPVGEIVFRAAYAPDGRTLATCGGGGAPTVRIWDVASGDLLRTLAGHELFVFAVAYAPDGTTLASAAGDSTVRIWDAASGATLRTLPHPEHPNDLAYAPDGTTLATVGRDGVTRIWDPATGSLVRTLPLAPGTNGGIAYSPDGRLLATAGADHAVQLVDPRTGRVVRSLRGLLTSLIAIRFTPDGKVLGTAADERGVRLWDVATGATLVTLVGHDGSVRALDFHPAGRLVATASVDQTVRIWDRHTGAGLHTLSGFKDDVTGVVFSRDGRTLVTTSFDGSIRLWDLTLVPGLGVGST